MDTEWTHHSEFYFGVLFHNTTEFMWWYIYFLVYSLFNMWHLDPITSFDMLISLPFILSVDFMLVGTETWIFADKMKKNYINLFTPSLFTWSI